MIFCYLITAKVIVFINNLYTYISEEITALSDSFLRGFMSVFLQYMKYLRKNT